MADVEPYAIAVTYLAGPGGRRITGQILRVDTGQYVWRDYHAILGCRFV